VRACVLVKSRKWCLRARMSLSLLVSGYGSVLAYEEEDTCMCFEWQCACL
jgi:hypothetical protein